MKLQHFGIGRLIFAAVLAAYSIYLVFNREAVMSSWLHGVSLAIHEAGHYFIFALAPEFLMILGGSLTQCVMPLLFVFQFWRTGQQYAVFATMFWVGYNVLDTAVYIADARAMQLPLLGGEAVIHDWNYLLTALNVLPFDELIASVFWGFGSLCMLVSVLGCVWYAQGDETRLPWQPSTDPEVVPVSSLRNLGERSGRLLNGIGIKTQADLEAFGALEAYMVLVEVRATQPSRSLLLALYGAVTNQDWQRINRVDKEKLFKQAGLLETNPPVVQ
jgi:hypothetical protein